VVHLVAERYRAEDERAVRAAGAAAFGCKPVRPESFAPMKQP